MKRKLTILSLVSAALLAVFATGAEAACAPFPKVTLWGDFTHAKVKRYVANKLDGDWSSYVTRLDKRLAALKRIQAKGKPLTLKYRGKKVVLRGSKLDAYVAAAAMRVDVAKCLASESDGEGLENFATAAGGVRALPRVAKPTTTAVSRNRMNLKVVSECRAGVATFKVTNKGKAWPQSGTVGIYRRGNEDRREISKRRIRFAAGQTSTFRVKSEDAVDGDLALWIRPSWAPRDYREDAVLSCG